MSFKYIDISAALTRLADRKIEQAMEEGKFSNLKGMGEPVDLEPLPADENARAMYWAMRLFKQNDVIPDEFRYRKQIESLRAELASVGSESRLRAIVVQVNTLVHRLNIMGTNVRTTDLIPLNAEVELEAFRARRGRAS